MFYPPDLPHDEADFMPVQPERIYGFLPCCKMPPLSDTTSATLFLSAFCFVGEQIIQRRRVVGDLRL